MIKYGHTTNVMLSEQKFISRASCIAQCLLRLTANKIQITIIFITLKFRVYLQ